MKLNEGELRTAFRAVVQRVAIGKDEVARARWWKWVEKAAPPARQTDPGRLTVSLGDVFPAQAVEMLRERVGYAGEPARLKEAV